MGQADRPGTQLDGEVIGSSPGIRTRPPRDFKDETMRELIKRMVLRAPGPLPLAALDTMRYVRYARVRQALRDERRILAKLGWPRRVLQGPFAGMILCARAYYSAFLPKIVGTYEREIASAIETICRARCDRLIDIGAAEGYYAVGMALRNPGCQVVAFELASGARYALRRLAERNGVSSQITLRGECTCETLSDALKASARPGVISDCEGAEDQLLDPDRVPALRRAYILVETHDGMFPGINQRLRDRFARTHRIEAIASQRRSADDLPAGTLLDARESATALSENRAWAEWFFLVPEIDRGS
jgi:hypothetical protein